MGELIQNECNSECTLVIPKILDENGAHSLSDNGKYFIEFLIIQISNKYFIQLFNKFFRNKKKLSLLKSNWILI